MSHSKPRRTPKYCHHKATGQAYVTIDGRSRYLGAYGSPESQEKYHRLIATWAAHGGQLPPTPEAGPSLTVTELCVRYFDRLFPRFSGHRVKPHQAAGS